MEDKEDSATGLINSNGRDEAISCPLGHRVEREDEFCSICGLRVIDFDTALKKVVEKLTDLSKDVWVRKTDLIMAAGSGGCNLLLTFLESDQLEDGSRSFLMINPSNEDISRSTQLFESLFSEKKVKVLTSSLLYRLKQSTSQTRSFWGLSETVASKDPLLSDRLMRAGIVGADVDQIATVLINIGEGEGSGVGPNLLIKARSINPEVGTAAICIIPSADEPDQTHFNAFCGLSRLLNYGETQVGDIIVLVSADRLTHIRGISRTGRELIGTDVLISFLQLLTERGEDDVRRVDYVQMSKLSRSLGIQNYVPIIGLGRSLEIYGSLGNILNSALYYPLAPMDLETVTTSHLIVRLSKYLAEDLKEENLKEEFYSWSRRKFPHLKGSLFYITYTDDRSDRLDAILLAGGSKITATIKDTIVGYHRFKDFIGDMNRWNDYATNPDELSKLEKTIEDYERRITASLEHRE